MLASPKVGLLAAVLVGCGARRALPSPAWPEPVRIGVGPVALDGAGELSVSLRVFNDSGVPVGLTHVAWAVRTPIAPDTPGADTPLAVTVAPGGHADLALHPPDRFPVSLDVTDLNALVSGTLSWRFASGQRRGTVFERVVAVRPSAPAEAKP